MQPLARQLLWSFGLLLLGVGSVTLAVNYYFSQRNLQAWTEQQAQSISHALEFATEGLLEVEQSTVLQRVVQNYGTLPGVEEITVISSKLTLMATSNSFPKGQTFYERLPGVQNIVHEAAKSGLEQQLWIIDGGKAKVIHLLPFSSTLFPLSSYRGVTLVVLNPDHIQQQPLGLLSQMGGLFLVASTIALGGIVWGICTWVLAPLKRLEIAVNQSQLEGVWQTINDLPANEIGLLGETFAKVFRARLESEAIAHNKALKLEEAIANLQQTQRQLWETERLARLSQALKDSEERYRAIVNQSAEGIILVDRYNKTIQEVNPAYCKLMGNDDWIGRSFYDLLNLSVSEIDLAFLNCSQDQSGCYLEAQIHSTSGKWLDVEIYFSPIVYCGQEVLCCGIRDITERKQTAAQLTYQAFYDPLTELPNRTFFQQALDIALEQAAEKRQYLAIFFIDIDRFKVVNDTLGHPVGDQLIKDLSDRLRQQLPSQTLLARWGGDEFTLLLSNIPHPENTQTLAEELQSILQSPFVLQGQEFHITSSIGIALYPQDGGEALTLLKHADIALYRAKDSGRNCYRFYSPHLDRPTSELLRLETHLHYALPRQELFLCYQPLVDVHRGQICGVEALIRWNHPEFGLIPPDQFISLAEETSLINRIGAWVMTTACAQNKAWQAQGLPPMQISVNLSARQIYKQPVAALVHQALTTTGLDPQWLELEITESSLMQDFVMAEHCLKELRQLGVRVAMDDFGTGYSSLSYFRKFSFDTIKIDQSFVRDVEQDPVNLAIVHSLVDLVQKTDRHLVIEGVETASQMRLLQDTGCNIMQGYLFCEPLRTEVITEKLWEWHRLGRFPLPALNDRAGVFRNA